MRIWHDNSGKGKFGCWYLNYVVVRDVQTKQKYQFVVNQWLAVEEGDGQVSICLFITRVALRWHYMRLTMYIFVSHSFRQQPVKNY